MSGNQKGFTIIELLVTIVVSGLIIAAVTTLFITIAKTQRSTQLLETASRAGEQQIESLRNSSYNALETDSTIDFTDDLPDNLPSPRKGLARISEPADDVKRVDVTITYKDGSKTKTVKLSSLIGQLGIGQ